MKSTAMRYASAAANVVAETLWPTRCAVCDAPGDIVCPTCAATHPFIDACRACPRCGAPFGLVQCTECNPVTLARGGRAAMPLNAMASALVFDEHAGRIVSAYKDGGDRRLHAYMARIMARYVAPGWLAEPKETAVTFIPASGAAKRRRGFDHAELLAHAVAEEVGLPCLSLLARPKSADQRKLSRAGRIANMQGSLRVQSEASVPAAVIAIDDVCTTGATMYAAADALREAGAQTVYGLTFARVWE